MTSLKNPLDSTQMDATPPDDFIDLTIAANQITGAENNPYEIRNALIVEEKKKKIRYKNGETLPNSALNLLNDAARKARHSRTLGNNILRANGNVTRPKDVDAHHVVAAQDARAKLSRKILFFIWFIAINDAANGVFMRRFSASKVAGLSNCPPHQGVDNILSDTYHLAVFMRLRDVSDEDATAGRAELRAIANEIVAGVFPY